MKIKNQKLNNLLYTVSANTLSMVVGIITSFVIPKILGVSEYGFFRLFTFYLTYVGLFSLGFVDGLYIKYGKFEYSDLPKERFRMFFDFLISQLIVLIILLFILIKTGNFDLSRKQLLYYVLLNLFIINLTQFFAYIAQFTKKFRSYSINLILSKLIFVLGCVFLFIFGLNRYKYYIYIQTITNIFILFLYLFYNSQLVFGKRESIKNNYKEILGVIKIGFLVMIGNFMSLLIIGIDRLFIDKLFTIEDFAMYSFAYSIISLYYLLLSSLATVLYPYLARTDINKMKNYYRQISILLVSVIGLSFSGYFILQYIVIHFLPKYTSALTITIILIPTVLFGGQNSILIGNYYKALQLSKEYTFNNALALITAILMGIIGYAIKPSPISIAAASLITFIIWVFFSNKFFKRKLGISLVKIEVSQIIIVVIFLIIAFNFSWIEGLIIYVLSFGVLIMLFFRKELKNIYFTFIKK